MRKPSRPLESESEWKKIGPCLYRYATNAVYYALAKRKSKQIRQSLRTTDLSLARRRLREFLDGLSSLDNGTVQITVDLDKGGGIFGFNPSGLKSGPDEF